MGIVKVKRGSVGKGVGKGNPGMLAGMSVSPGIIESTTKFDSRDSTEWKENHLTLVVL